MTRLALGLSLGVFAIALLTACAHPLFAAMSAAIALAVLVGRHFYHSVEVR